MIILEAKVDTQTKLLTVVALSQQGHDFQVLTDSAQSQDLGIYGALRAYRALYEHCQEAIDELIEKLGPTGVELMEQAREKYDAN